MKNEKILSLVTLVMWLLQLVAETLLFVVVWRLDMLPGKYLGAAAALLVMVWALIGILVFLQGGRRRRRMGLRITALILASLMVLGCAGASGMVAQLHTTMNNVTDKNEITTMMTVYVRKDDAAQTVADTVSYRYAILTGMGDDQTGQALTQLEQELNSQLSVAEFSTVAEAVDALYQSQVDAILMSSAYTGLLKNVDSYKDFPEKTRVLHEITIVGQVPAQPQGSGDTLTDRPVVGDKQDGNQADSPTYSEPASVTNTPFVVYLSGSDSRETTLTARNSDVNILAVVNPVTKQVLLLNTPRDYYIPHPFSDRGTKDKLTHLGCYGIDCSMSGLATLYRERIDFYGQINFTGFETLIDAIGGVTVSFDRSFTARGETYIQAGENWLDGRAALNVARERSAFSDGDNARGRNQMKIIKAVILKMVSGALIANYSEILESLEGMFVTDMSMKDISSLVKMQLGDMASWNIQTFAVSGDTGSEITYSIPGDYASVMYVDQGMVDYATSLIEKVIDGQILTEGDMEYPG